jgi:hypothetical protein
MKRTIPTGNPLSLVLMGLVPIGFRRKSLIAPLASVGLISASESWLSSWSCPLELEDMLENGWLRQSVTGPERGRQTELPYRGKSMSTQRSIFIGEGALPQ